MPLYGVINTLGELAAYSEPSSSSNVSDFTKEDAARTSGSWVQYEATNIILHNIYFSSTVQSEKTPETTKKPTKKPTNSDRSSSSSSSSKVSDCAQKDTALYGWALQYNIKELNAFCIHIYFFIDVSQSTKKPTRRPTRKVRIDILDLAHFYCLALKIFDGHRNLTCVSQKMTTIYYTANKETYLQ